MSAAKPIAFFKKNCADYTNAAVVVSASQGNAYAPFVQRRSNTVGWMTTGSVDADNTTLTIDFVNMVALTDVLLVGHNFKAFTVKYWDGSAYQAFPTPINESANADSTSRFSFALTNTTKIQIRITGTQTPNAEKRLNQVIATELIAQLNGWPVIASPVFNLNKRDSLMLSGKHAIGVNLGGFSFDLTVANWRDGTDLTTVETLFLSGNSFLVWLCGGNQTQFSSVRIGYRLQDLYLMKCLNDLSPEFVNGLYQTGMKIKLSLVEVTS